MSWVVNKERDTAIGLIPKAGSVSLRESNLFDEHKLSNEDVIDIPVRVVFLREPIVRLQSCYSFFHYLSIQTPTAKNSGPDKGASESWEKFVDFILVNPNPHWNSQVEMLSVDEKYLATITHKFEDIHKLWGKYVPGLLPWANACTHLPINDYRRNEINKYYGKDNELWHSL